MRYLKSLYSVKFTNRPSLTSYINRLLHLPTYLKPQALRTYTFTQHGLSYEPPVHRDSGQSLHRFDITVVPRRLCRDHFGIFPARWTSGERPGQRRSASEWYGATGEWGESRNARRNPSCWSNGDEWHCPYATVSLCPFHIRLSVLYDRRLKCVCKKHRRHGQSRLPLGPQDDCAART